MKCLHTMSWSGCHTVHVHHWSATQEEWLPCLQSKLCTVHLQQRKTLEIKLWEKSKQKCKKKHLFVFKVTSSYIFIFFWSTVSILRILQFSLPGWSMHRTVGCSGDFLQCCVADCFIWSSIIWELQWSYVNQGVLKTDIFECLYNAASVSHRGKFSNSVPNKTMKDPLCNCRSRRLSIRAFIGWSKATHKTVQHFVVGLECLQTAQVIDSWNLSPALRN